jgi:queuosine biosynthesis protein QueC
MPRAVVLLSGGLDSATVLAIARSRGFQCHALSFDYGQRHRGELEASEKISRSLGAVEHRVFKLDLAQWGGSALTDPGIDVPDYNGAGIPVTYVPARNMVFLSLATAWGEVIGAHDIFIGVNSVDYSGYPDCRKAFISSFAEKLPALKKNYYDYLMAEELEKVVANEKSGYVFFKNRWQTAKSVTDQLIKYYFDVTKKRHEVEKKHFVTGKKPAEKKKK